MLLRIELGPSPAAPLYRLGAGSGSNLLRKFGEVPEWPNGPDCKSGGVSLRWFESTPHHQLDSSIFNSCDVKDLCEIKVLDLSKRTAYKSKEALIRI